MKPLSRLASFFFVILCAGSCLAEISGLKGVSSGVARRQRFELAGPPDAERIIDSRGKVFKCARVKAAHRRPIVAGRVFRHDFFDRSYGKAIVRLSRQIAAAPAYRAKKFRKHRSRLLAARAQLDNECRRRRSSSSSASSSSASGTNHAPIAELQTVATPLNTPLRIKLHASDVDQDELAYTVAAGPAHGALSGNPPDLIYTPQSGYSGQDRFEFTVSDGIIASAPSAVTIFVGGWQPPLGIPMPDFGLAQEAPAYDENNPRHYYVNGPNNCSNSNNGGRGSPGAALCMIPKSLPPGAYVEVHGGPYPTSPFLPSWAGTASEPIFIKGVNFPRFNKAFNVYNDAGGGGGYVVLEGFSFFSFHVGNNYHHLALRGSDVHGGIDQGGISIHANETEALIHHIVLYNNTIHDNGVWDPKLAQGDRDIHGLAVGWYCRVEHLWVLDNDIYHNEGDAIQINAGPNAPNSYVNHIYIGRNTMHHNKQSGVALKSSDYVVVSQNNIYGHRRSSSAMGPGIGFSDNGPQSAWFIFNRIHNNEIGIKMNGGNAPGPYYIIGNLIYDIHAFTDGTYNADDPYHFGQAVVDWHPAKKYFIGNTVYDTDGGYGLAGWNWGASRNLTVINNIFSQMTPATHILNISDPAAAQAAVLGNNIFAAPFSMQWGARRFYSSLESFHSGTGQAAACLSADPEFVDSGAGDFHTTGASPARNAGSSAVIEQLTAVFLSAFAQDIAKDLEGVSRPQGAAWDIGAYEF